MSLRHLGSLAFVVLFAVMAISVVDRVIWASKLDGSINSKFLLETVGYDISPECAHAPGPRLEYDIRDDDAIIRCSTWRPSLVVWPFYNTVTLDKTPERAELFAFLAGTPD